MVMTGTPIKVFSFCWYSKLYIYKVALMNNRVYIELIHVYILQILNISK